MRGQLAEHGDVVAFEVGKFAFCLAKGHSVGDGVWVNGLGLLVLAIDGRWDERLPVVESGQPSPEEMRPVS